MFQKGIASFIMFELFALFHLVKVTNMAFSLFVSIIIDAKFWDQLIEIEALSIRALIIIDLIIISVCVYSCIYMCN